MGRGRLKFDILLCSGELRKAIRENMDMNNICPFRLSAKLRIGYERFRLYLNTTDPRKSTLNIKHEEMIRLCKEVGISFKLVIVKENEPEIDFHITRKSKKYATKQSR